MKKKQTKAYGSWLSPISAEMLSASAVKLGQTFIDSERAYWLEARPAEGGRTVLVQAFLADLKPGRGAPGFQLNVEDVTGREFNIRNAVHEYGGGAAIIAGEHVYFSNFADNRIYRQNLADKKVSVLGKEGPFRYADFCFDSGRNRLILVKEDHSEPEMEALNSLDVLSLDGNSESQILLAGSDFFSSPRLSPDERMLCWLTWNHPNMPWDETKLWTANLGKDGSLTNIQHVAGGNGESVTQPEWGPDGTLYFVSDRNGWWNLYASYSGLVEPLVEMEAEFAVPHWVFALSNYAVSASNRIVCSYSRAGVWQLAELDTESRKLTDIETPYQDIRFVRCAGNRVVFRGGAADRFAEIAFLDLENKDLTVLRRANECALENVSYAQAESLEFPTKDSGKAYAFFYAPASSDYSAPEGSLPPLIVKNHGGPTSACVNTLDLGIQYWTSRGFAVVDVNYGGSSGFGRAYRQRLQGTWGVVDVDDCVSAVKYLIAQQRANPSQIAITGASAGGFTTLCALAFQGENFSAGASYYGVSDPTALAQDTHKFESRYLDRLIGPYPERKDLYEERSPMVHAGQISCPVIFFQGLDDKVVPPSQSELMAGALKKKRLPVALLTFAGEQHGFRQAQTIKSCLEAELTFYCRVFNIERPDLQKDLMIENADRLPMPASLSRD